MPKFALIKDDAMIGLVHTPANQAAVESMNPDCIVVQNEDAQADWVYDIGTGTVKPPPPPT